MAIHGEWWEGAALTFAADPTRPWAENETSAPRGNAHKNEKARIFALVRAK
jgi:hypothetical protein